MTPHERRLWEQHLSGKSSSTTLTAPSTYRQLSERERALLSSVGIKPKRQRSALEETLCGNLDVMGVRYLREFHADNISTEIGRGWRFDLAILPLELRLLVEIHGGLGSGKHSRREGQANDLEKANAATEHGWSVLSYGASQINSGAAALQIERLIRQRIISRERAAVTDGANNRRAVGEAVTDVSQERRKDK
jgi:very-short-patch-repair endonuclease